MMKPVYSCDLRELCLRDIHVEFGGLFFKRFNKTKTILHKLIYREHPIQMNCESFCISILTCVTWHPILGSIRRRNLTVKKTRNRSSNWIRLYNICSDMVISLHCIIDTYPVFCDKSTLFEFKPSWTPLNIQFTLSLCIWLPWTADAFYRLKENGLDTVKSLQSMLGIVFPGMNVGHHAATLTKPTEVPVDYPASPSASHVKGRLCHPVQRGRSPEVNQKKDPQEKRCALR